MNLNEQNSAREIQDISSIFEETDNVSSQRMSLNPKTAKKVGRPKGKRKLDSVLSKKRNNRMRKNNKRMINLAMLAGNLFFRLSLLSVLLFVDLFVQ